MVEIRYNTSGGEQFTIGCDDELRNVLLHYDASSLVLIAEKDTLPEKKKEGGDKKPKDPWTYLPTDKSYPKAPLAMNMTSKEVKKLQTALEKMGYLDKKTMEDEFGNYGPDTVQALRKFRGTFAVGREGPRNKMYSGEAFDEECAKALEQLSCIVKSKPAKKK